MERKEFEILVREAYQSLPHWVKARICNVALIIEDDVSEEERQRQGLSNGETLLGLYVGIPATERGSNYGVGETLPDKIIIFQKPILEAAGSSSDLIRKAVRDTVLHEFAHYFGMTEEEIEKREARGW